VRTAVATHAQAQGLPSNCGAWPTTVERGSRPKVLMDTPVKVWCAAAEDLETVLTLWGCVVFNGRTCTRHTQTHSCTRTHTSHHLRGLQNSKRLHVTGEAHATLPRLGVVNTLVAGPALPRCRVFQSALFPTRLCSPKVGTSDSPVKKLRTLGVSRHFFVWLLTRVCVRVARFRWAPWDAEERLAVATSKHFITLACHSLPAW
jgi:hypothetical protein